MFSLRGRHTDLDECIEDYTTWFVNNRPRQTENSSSSLEQQVRFLSLALDGSLYILHLLRDELRKQQATGTGLWLPVSA